MTRVDPVVREYLARRRTEMRKALEKYGAVALEPGGDPARDVVDYAINELIGLVRYAQMIEYRTDVATPASTAAQQRAYDTLRGIARQVEATAGRLGYDLIAARQTARRAGIRFGEGEHGS